ncbi:MAG TPA: hypothetical protein PKC87_01165 [Candidatus Absconditabacterales bacterium]|nr:hypothetical protein [Candidatus Absconditabacterales bacterium]
MKKTFLMSILFGLLILPTLSFAQTQNDFEIIPKATSGGGVSTAVEAVGKTGGSVRDTYNQEAKAMEGKVGDQIASGIMTRDTLLDYIVYLVRFLSQIGIVIGVLMIIYAGYLYASSIFSSSNMSKGKSAITNAIIGVLVIAFSYAIMKLLTSAFLS